MNQTGLPCRMSLTLLAQPEARWWGGGKLRQQGTDGASSGARLVDCGESGIPRWTGGGSGRIDGNGPPIGCITSVVWHSGAVGSKDRLTQLLVCSSRAASIRLQATFSSHLVYRFRYDPAAPMLRTRPVGLLQPGVPCRRVAQARPARGGALRSARSFPVHIPPRGCSVPAAASWGGAVRLEGVERRRIAPVPQGTCRPQDACAPRALSDSLAR
mmetsp:Transcript_37100/g.119257  ORF Transcript_37100/g.119257 Transcript_37100/m.119257 type:complete len:214 (+) Transcript_37100:464-1105(+)|eukprot:scaffold10064_cov130-Isochrysis_galbana.AAC.13